MFISGNISRCQGCGGIDTILHGLETNLLCIKLHTDVTSSVAHDAFAKNGGVVSTPILKLCFLYYEVH